MKTLIFTLSVAILSPLFLSAQQVARVEVSSAKAKVENSLKTENASTRSASFVGGEAAFYQYLQNELKFPRKVVSSTEELVVLASFSINSDGSISDIEIENATDKKFEAQLFKALKAMPSWLPAMENGELVSQKWIQPIRFKFN